MCKEGWLSQMLCARRGMVDDDNAFYCALYSSMEMRKQDMSPTNRRKLFSAYAQRLQHEWDDLGRSLESI